MSLDPVGGALAGVSIKKNVALLQGAGVGVWAGAGAPDQGLQGVPDHGWVGRPVAPRWRAGCREGALVAYRLGADDYVVKPFPPKELVARVRAVLRRARPAEGAGPVLSAGPLTLDVARHLVTLEGRPLTLTPKEFDLLHALLEAAGRVLSREHLLHRVWGYARAGEIESRPVDVHVRRLHAKLGDFGRRIATVKSVGYRFEAE